MSQHFLNLIRQGNTTEIAAAVEADASVARSRDAQGVSALMWSIYTGQTVIRDFLLSGLDDLDVFEAAAAGNCERLHACLKEDALRARAASPDGWTPLHLAAAFGGLAPVVMLLEHGAHVHQYSHNAQKNQPLHACIALNNSAEVAELLIDAGADVNATQVGGFTPLHSAAAAGKRGLIVLLIEHGAKVDCLCAQGKSPADYARERGHTDIEALLNKG